MDINETQDIFINLSEEEKDVIKNMLKPYINLKEKNEWFNKDGTALSNLNDMLELSEKYPILFQVTEFEDRNEVFVSIDTDVDGTFDRNVTYKNGIKITETIDINNDFNNELSLEYDSEGNIKKGAVDINDDGEPEMEF